MRSCDRPTAPSGGHPLLPGGTPAPPGVRPPADGPASVCREDGPAPGTGKSRVIHRLDEGQAVVGGTRHDGGMSIGKRPLTPDPGGEQDPASALDSFSPATRGVVHGGVQRAHRRPGRRLAGHRARAPTCWSWRRPAPARRWPPSSPPSTGWRATPPPAEAEAALPGALRLAAQGPRGRRGAQSAQPAHRACARRRSGSACPSRRSGSAIRSGDTPAAERRSLATKPPDILITTPESLFLMLTSAAREALRGVETVILDEVHAVAGTKRGAHLALSPGAAGRAAGRPARRIGLSATVRPVDEVARFLSPQRKVTIVQPPSQKEFDLSVVVPVEDLGELGGSPAADAGGSGRRRAALDLAARRGADRRPGPGAPLDHRLRQLPPPRRAAVQPAQRDRLRAGHRRAAARGTTPRPS